jgi:hypothetical protein
MANKKHEEEPIHKTRHVEAPIIHNEPLIAPKPALNTKALLQAAIDQLKNPSGGNISAPEAHGIAAILTTILQELSS